MAEDWAVNVRKYAPDAEDAVIAAIVRHCGISLQSRDSSLVSFGDPAETKRVRDNYCRRKLGLTESDSDLDLAINRVGERMKDDPTRNRVTVYYLLADEFRKLGLFGAAAAATAAAATPASAAPTLGGEAAASAPRAYASPTRSDESRDDEVGAGFALAVAGGLGAIILGTAVAGTVIGGQVKQPAVVAVAPMAATPVVSAPAAPAAAIPAVPTGAGITAAEAEGKPMVSVYFDTAKTDVTPDFASTAAPLKTWIDGHPGARLSVSGYNDPRGDAAFNAELSKNRAKAVAAALGGIGVPADVIDLDKPPETTDTEPDMARARRVDVTVKDGPG